MKDRNFSHYACTIAKINLEKMDKPKMPFPKVSSSSNHQINKSAEPYILLPISLGAEIIVDIVNLKMSIKGKLVGVEQNSFLLVKFAPNDLMGTFRKMVTKSPVISKYQYKDVIYGFHTEILNIVSNPCKLIFLAYPKKIEEFKVQPNVRYESDLPAMAMLDGLTNVYNRVKFNEII